MYIKKKRKKSKKKKEENKIKGRPVLFPGA